MPQEVRGGGISTGAFLLATLLTVAFGVGIVVAGYFWMAGPGLAPDITDAVTSATGRADPAEAPAPVDDGTWTDADIETARTKRRPRPRSPRSESSPHVSADRVGLGGPDSGMVERSTYLLCGATTQANASLPELLAEVVHHGHPGACGRVQAGLAASVLEQAQRSGAGARVEAAESQPQWQAISDDLDQTTREVATMHEEIVASFRSLVADGIILPEHFAKFLGLGIPTGDRQDDRRRHAAQEPLRLTLLISATRD